MALKKQILYKLRLYLGIVGIGLGLTIGILGSFTPVSAQYAGCPGSTQQGPPSPGTVCSDGSSPLKDPSLPIGCPGSAQVGPTPSNYTVVCPARPGRAECTYSAQTRQCTNDSPPGCPGSRLQGPPSAGTVCPDGSTPIRDPSLPYGCPGSTAMGPPPANYTVVCPARPGRAECTYSEATKQCTPGAPGSTGTTGGKPSNAIQGNCQSEVIDKTNCPIFARLIEFINVLSGLVAIIIVLMITFRGMQYTFSRDNAQTAAQAKEGIRDAVLALVGFLFIYAFLQWVVPGGVF